HARGLRSASRPVPGCLQTGDRPARKRRTIKRREDFEARRRALPGRTTRVRKKKSAWLLRAAEIPPLPTFSPGNATFLARDAGNRPLATPIGYRHDVCVKRAGRSASRGAGVEAWERDAVLAVVQRYWGFESLRPLQEEAIIAGLERRDSLVVMPTGGGK